MFFLLKYKLHPEPSSFNFFFSYGMAVKSFHSFRHTVSTYLENQPNVETFQVNRLLGHNSKTTTEQRYAKSDIKRLREVLSLLQYNSDPFEILGWPCLSDHDVAEQIKLLPVLERF